MAADLFRHPTPPASAAARSSRRLSANGKHSANGSHGAGFTLVEILVVVGILALLASVLLVVGSRAWRAADATRLGAQLQTVAKALEAYKTDFGSFPVTRLEDPTITYDNVANEAGYRGARLLCKALIAPTPQGTSFNATGFRTDLADQDGHDGPGFRVPPRSGIFKRNATDPNKLEGQVYGPYINGNGFSWGKLSATNPVQIDTADTNYDDTTVLADANGNVILYYPVLNASPTMTTPGAYVGPGTTTSFPMYRSTDNSNWYSQDDLRKLLGDRDANGLIDNGETAVVKGQYLLISAGKDGLFGPNANDKNKANDDVTNFGQ